MIIHHDQDGVFTGYEWWVRQLLADGVRVSYTLNGFKDKPQMESFLGRFKEENRSVLLEAQAVAELVEVVDQRLEYYNTQRWHSGIGYLSPVAYIERLRAAAEG